MSATTDPPVNYDVSTRTPWGTADSVQKYAPGINFYTTPGHGGFKVAAGKNAKIHDAWRQADGWYEEDCDWAIVAITFPEFFAEKMVDEAHASAKHWHADAYKHAVDHCADCELPIRDVPGGSVTIIELYQGKPVTHLHRGCMDARCGYCSGRGTKRDGDTCPRCHGSGKDAVVV